MSKIAAVRTAALEWLNSQADKPAPIHEHIQENTPKPYISLGDKTEVPFNRFGGDGYEETITFSIFSTYKGDQQLLEINEWLMEKLHRQKIQLADGSSVKMKSELMTTTRTVDGVRQLVNRFRMIALSSST